jgi:hypothetical protein
MEFETLYRKDMQGKILCWRAAIEQDLIGVDIVIQYGDLNGKLAERRTKNIQGKNAGKSNATSPYSQAEANIDSLYKKKRRSGYRSLTDLDYFKNKTDWETIEVFLARVLSSEGIDLEGNLKPMLCQQYYRSKKTHTVPGIKKAQDGWIDPTGKMWKDRKYYYILNPYEPKEKGALIVKFPCLIQPKINGVRATIHMDNEGTIKILSKSGLRYKLPHITDFLKESLIFEHTYITIDKEDDQLEIEGNTLILDGELYIHGESLQVIGSAVDSFNMDTHRIKFVAFDLAIADVSNISRYILLKDIVYSIYGMDIPIEVIPTKKINGDTKAQVLTDEYIRDGYEGSILRNMDAEYQFGKRPVTMCKLKRHIDEEFKIIDIVPQKKDPDLGMFYCVTKNGHEFSVTPSMTVQEKKELMYMKHLYIGKELNCSFYEYTDAGIPFHIIDSHVRIHE